MSGSSDMSESLDIKPPQANYRSSQSNRSPKRHERVLYSPKLSRSPYRHSHLRSEEYRSRRRLHHRKHRHSHRSSVRDLRQVLYDKRDERQNREKRVIFAHEESERNVDKLRVRVQRQVVVEVNHKHYDKHDRRKGYSTQSTELKYSRYNSNKRHSSGDRHSHRRKRHKRERNDGERNSKSGSSDNNEPEVVAEVEGMDLTPKEEVKEPMEAVVSSSSDDSDEDSDDSSSTKTAESDDSNSEQENNHLPTSPVKKESRSSESEDDVIINSSVKKESKAVESDEDIFLESAKNEGLKESSSNDSDDNDDIDINLLPPYLPAIQGCRSVEEFQCLNKIEEGSFGVVYRAQDKRTKEMVALKKLKMAKEKEGFPITALREINTLLKAQHPNIVTVREIVVGSNIDQVYIVMDFVDQDLNVLMKSMKRKNQMFLASEVKCLMQQMLLAVAHLHDNWILHRDLKTSNLLLSDQGVLKIGDFGLAREYGSPLKPYTPLVVTLWYRSPELLLAPKLYSTHVDMWAVGCVFAELITLQPLFPGKTEAEQITRIFKDLGTPTDSVWPGFSSIPMVQKLGLPVFPVNQLWTRLGDALTSAGMDLINKFLTYDPAKRISAEDALAHTYFSELPAPTMPSKSALEQRKAGKEMKSAGGFHMDKQPSAVSLGFSLKF